MLINLTFDGGTRPRNPGRGYGSYLFKSVCGTLKGKSTRLEFGEPITNNQAEYMALLAGLRHLRTEASGCIPLEEILLNIYGDSLLVIKQLDGTWKRKRHTLAVLCKQAHELLAEFGDWAPIWHPREKSVELFGH